MTEPQEKPLPCPEKERCLALKGKPIGMYHCSECGDMILAGVDPTPYCNWNQRAGEGVKS